jgi:hypothetical protein
MERIKKLALIQRSLGIRHKIKVHESLKAPDSHEELAIMLLAKWELEDELHAIESAIGDARMKNVDAKKRTLLKEDPLPPELRAEEAALKGKRGKKS